MNFKKSQVTTLSQEFIFARIAENNTGGIFSKFLLDAGCDNLPKLLKKPFLKKCGLRPFVSSQLIYEDTVGDNHLSMGDIVNEVAANNEEKGQLLQTVLLSTSSAHNSNFHLSGYLCKN